MTTQEIAMWNMRWDDNSYVDDNGDFFTVTQLQYDIDQNIFIDCGGYIVYNIFEYITPSDLMLFKHRKEYMLVERRCGGFVELIWPDDEDGEWSGYN
jgi:hypothetical protein